MPEGLLPTHTFEVKGIYGFYNVIRGSQVEGTLTALRLIKRRYHDDGDLAEIIVRFYIV